MSFGFTGQKSRPCFRRPLILWPNSDRDFANILRPGDLHAFLRHPPPPLAHGLRQRAAGGVAPGQQLPVSLVIRGRGCTRAGRASTGGRRGWQRWTSPGRIPTGEDPRGLGVRGSLDLPQLRAAMLAADAELTAAVRRGGGSRPSLWPTSRPFTGSDTSWYPPVADRQGGSLRRRIRSGMAARRRAGPRSGPAPPGDVTPNGNRSGPRVSSDV